jgi:hypothetical protein
MYEYNTVDSGTGSQGSPYSSPSTSGQPLNTPQQPLSMIEKLVRLIKSGEANPQSVAAILGLSEGEYDPTEFRMPTLEQLQALRPGSYLDDFTSATMKYNQPMAQTALNIGSIQGGLRTSQDKVRGDLQSMLNPYRGAIDTAQSGMESSMHRAESDIWDLAGDWLSRAEIG